MNYILYVDDKDDDDNSVDNSRPTVAKPEDIISKDHMPVNGHKFFLSSS